jgi:cell fate regulator YaaT (PSP1 superfamily)
MPTVVGVKLRFAPKALWFDPVEANPEEGDTVIVETERGTELGLVSQAPKEVADADLPAPLKPITRVATAEDLATAEEYAEREREAMPVFRQLVEKYKLDMKPIDVEYLFGGDKIVFYFAAEERVDFRELVRELASNFKQRIDMRQVGVRDEARMVGGLGHCGQPLCCVRFGGEFQPVSIRMAKEQDLPLNPLKISGLCGRLMCCLRYEFEAYRDYKQRAPKKGAIIETPLGLAKVAELNTPHETVGMRLEDGKRFTVALKDMECNEETGKPCSVCREVLEQTGGTGLALAFAALDREAEPEPAPAAAPPKPRKRRGGGEGRGGEKQGAAAREKRGGTADEKRGGERGAQAAPAEAGTAAGPPARKRRRRKGGGSSGGSGGSSDARQGQGDAKPATPAEKPTGQKPAQQGPAEAGGEGGSARPPGRRRRRRRPGSGGGAGSGDAPSA